MSRERAYGVSPGDALRHLTATDPPPLPLLGPRRPEARLGCRQLFFVGKMVSRVAGRFGSSALYPVATLHCRQTAAIPQASPKVPCSVASGCRRHVESTRTVPPSFPPTLGTDTIDPGTVTLRPRGLIRRSSLATAQRAVL